MLIFDAGNEGEARRRELPEGNDRRSDRGLRRHASERSAKKGKGRKSERRMPRLSGGEEGRGKLRKGAGICKQELIRAYPNGATRQVEGLPPP